MQRPNVKILTSCYGGQVTAGYFHSILNLVPYAQQNGFSLSVETLPNCSLISLGRSMMLGRALEDKAWTHILWIDADLKFKPQYIHAMLLDDKEIIGGFYPKKELPIDFASSPAPNGEQTDSFFETIYVATGFMLIKREVVEKMTDHYKKELTFRYQTSEYVDLFGTFIDENSLYLTEDYAFCHRARAIGIKTYMSKRFELPHTGSIEYSAEQEDQKLADYEKSGRITINKDHKVNYFSAFRTAD